MNNDRVNLYLDRDRLDIIQNTTGECLSDIVTKGLDLYYKSLNEHAYDFLKLYNKIKSKVEIMENLELDEEQQLILDSYKSFLAKGKRVRVVKDLKL